MPDACTLEQFNSAPPDALRPALRACATSPAWADRMLAGRPYGSADELAAAAEKAVLALDAAEVDAALDGHPRIGERPGGAHAARAEPAGWTGAALSRREQSGVDPDGAARARLAEANARYEQRFGHVFLIRAAGRGTDAILAELERRLGNDPAAERAEAVAQLAEITALRSRQVLAG